MKPVLEKKLMFTVATREDEQFKYNAHTLLRLACYPIAAKQGLRKNYQAIFQVSVDGALTDLMEQDQYGVTDVAACDLNLVRYFLHTEYEDGDDMEAIRDMRLHDGEVWIRQIGVTIKFWEKKK